MSSSLPATDNFMDVDRDDVDWVFLNQLLLARDVRLPSTVVVKTAPPANDKLPAEILQEIFEYLVVPFEDARATKQETKGSQACIAVTQVCRFWRYSAQAHSRLWTNLSPLPITRLGLTDDDIFQQLKCMRAFLALSKSKPLHIKHDLVESDEYSAANLLFVHLVKENPPQIAPHQAPVYHAGRMLMALAHAQSRWETLDITFDSPFLYLFLQAARLVDAVNLKRLVIKLKGASYRVLSYEGLHRWISKFPNLDYLRVESVGLYSELLFSFSLKVPNVELRREHMSLCCCVDFLIKNVYSTSITLDGRPINGPKTPGVRPPCNWNVDKHPVTPPSENMVKLEKLTLYGIRGSINIFQFIRIPSLKVLEIYDGYFGMNDNLSLQFATLISRPHCVLERFIIHNARLSKDTILQMLTWEAIQDIKQVSFGPVRYSEVAALARLPDPDAMVFKDPSLGIVKLPLRFKVWRKKDGQKDRGCFLGWK